MTDQIPPPCAKCGKPCPDDPSLAFVVRWMGMDVTYLCSEDCAREYRASDPGCDNSDKSLEAKRTK